MLLNIEFDFTHERKVRRRKPRPRTRRIRKGRLQRAGSIVTCRLVELNPTTLAHPDTDTYIAQDGTTYRNIGRTLDDLVAAVEVIADPDKDIAENRQVIKAFVSRHAVMGDMILRRIERQQDAQETPQEPDKTARAA